LVDLLAETDLVRSKAEARRAIDQGGVYLNNHRVEDPETTVGPSDLLHDRYLVLRRGKRTYHVVRLT
jgi:tyrosyl-tRNA synthetase